MSKIERSFLLGVFVMVAFIVGRYTQKFIDQRSTVKLCLAHGTAHVIESRLQGLGKRSDLR